MVLDDYIILQADATVIGGLLILLTVTFYLAPRSIHEVDGEIAVNAVIKISRAAIIFFGIFSASAILVLLGDVFESYHITLTNAYHITLTILGKYVMIIGFAALAIGIGWTLWYWARTNLIPMSKGKEQPNHDSSGFWSRVKKKLKRVQKAD